MIITGRGQEADQVVALRMIDYIQSIIASVPPSQDAATEVSEEEWQALKSDVAELFNTLSYPYQVASTAIRKAQAPHQNVDLEEFQVRAELMWINVRGQRYHVHERQALADILAPHTDVLQRLFGVSAEDIINEFDKILVKLTAGIQQMYAEFEAFREQIIDHIENIDIKVPIDNTEQLRDMVFENSELRDARERLFGSLFGYDLFDVMRNTNLPERFLDALSFEPGEEGEFFAPGPYRGWPLRVWPVMKRPFIKLDKKNILF